MTMQTDTLTRPFPLPSARTVANLAIGGFAGLGFWSCSPPFPPPGSPNIRWSRRSW